MAISTIKQTEHERKCWECKGLIPKGVHVLEVWLTNQFGNKKRSFCKACALQRLDDKLVMIKEQRRAIAKKVYKIEYKEF